MVPEPRSCTGPGRGWLPASARDFRESVQINHGPSELVVVLPVTSRANGIPFHVTVNPPEGGVRQPSYIKCEDIRSVSRFGLRERWGAVASSTLAAVEDRRRILMGL